MIVVRSPKGWTGPKVVDGLQIEGTFRAHQVPLLVDEAHPGHVELLDAWMRSYKPDELFDQAGRLLPDLAALAPRGRRRMGANPHTNGGVLLRDLRMPDYPRPRCDGGLTGRGGRRRHQRAGQIPAGCHHAE